MGLYTWILKKIYKDKTLFLRKEAALNNKFLLSRTTASQNSPNGADSWTDCLGWQLASYAAL